MTARPTPRVLTIPPGAPFLPTLADALKDGRLVPGFTAGDDPLALSDVTIFVPTRRAARELRSVFAETSGARSAILPTVKALGEFDDGEAAFVPNGADLLSFAPPVPAIDRLLLLAPLVRAWKEKLPLRLKELFAEEVIVPASTADAIWLARDLAALMDEIELEGSDWSKLGSLVSDDLASWWQVTLDFLEIVTEHWPSLLAELGQSNPAAHRDALLRAEAERLRRHPPAGPVIAAGSTGSIPGTAELLSAIARLPNGAVVLPGLDLGMDEAAWRMIAAEAPEPTVFGHPQYGLAKLLAKLGLTRSDVVKIGAQSPALADRAWLVGEALRPADATDRWLESRHKMSDARLAAALEAVDLIEAANERDEAAAIAVALRRAIETPGARAALVTADRSLARRVSTELMRFGIVADDSGGTPLSNTPPATLLRLLAHCAFEPGYPVAIVALLKHPLVRLGLARDEARRLVEVIELVALRGGTGRPDVAALGDLYRSRLAELTAARAEGRRVPHWLPRVLGNASAAAGLLERLEAALAPLAELRAKESTTVAEAAVASVLALEAVGRDEAGAVDELYARDAGAKLVEFLRQLAEASVAFAFAPAEWPSVLDALMAPEVVKPTVASDPRISIWGALEARLQSVDTLVAGGLNEGSWPRRPQTDRLMSRIMKTGIDLEPPERRIGLAAHDFQMAMGAAKVILSRAGRDGDAPTVPSRWLQRLRAFIGEDAARAMVRRGDACLAAGRRLDQLPGVPFAPRPDFAPPVDLRPRHFSVTEIETLRRDPYAIYARHVLALRPLDPLIREPGAAERGTLFHEILNRFSRSEPEADPAAALRRLVAIGRECFDEEALPPDVDAVWWPRFQRLAGSFLEWEAQRATHVTARRPEARAAAQEIEDTGVTLSGYADRVDVLRDGRADILDYKTGSSPSKRQAHTLVSPQLPLEAALLERGAFESVGGREPADLAYVRLKGNGSVIHESILDLKGSVKSGPGMAADAWQRLVELMEHYRNPATGYLSRALPFKESDTGGDYDHLARVLEWSAGATLEEDVAPE